MSQMGFFDADKRLSMLSAKGDPLVSICALVQREKFRRPDPSTSLRAGAALVRLEAPVGGSRNQRAAAA